MAIKELTGVRQGHLVVIDKTAKRTKQGGVIWKCRCDCGNVCEKPSASLYKGTGLCSRQCPLHPHAVLKDSLYTSRVYRVWANMKQRCENPNNPNYKYYGARGIGVCEAWSNSFMAFYDCVGDAPDGLTLDRIDNALGYVEGNVRWVNMSVQNANKRGIIDRIQNNLREGRSPSFKQ